MRSRKIKKIQEKFNKLVGDHEDNVSDYLVEHPQMFISHTPISGFLTFFHHLDINKSKRRTK